jgi:hypothetical protein
MNKKKKKKEKKKRHEKKFVWFEVAINIMRG